VCGMSSALLRHAYGYAMTRIFGRYAIGLIPTVASKRSQELRAREMDLLGE